MTFGYCNGKYKGEYHGRRYHNNLSILGEYDSVAYGGTSEYYFKSNPCVAAVHYGAIKAESSGFFKYFMSGSKSKFSGSIKNGVLTSSYPPPTSYNESYACFSVRSLDAQNSN